MAESTKLTTSEILRRVAKLPPEERKRAERALLLQYQPSAVVNRTPEAEELEAQGWEVWLQELAPHIFRGTHAEFHRDFWDWYWPLLIAKRDGRRLTDLDVPLAYLLTLFRGAGKSTVVEWANIAMGALWGQVLSLYISSVAKLARGHLNNIREEIEDSQVTKYYPGLSNPEVGKFNNRYGWNQDLLATQSGLTIFAAGLEEEVRGLKRRQHRPGLICHQKGTRIFADGRWMLVEEHPTAQQRYSNGYKIRVWGVPEPEVVTPEHRYWVREYVPNPRHALSYLEGSTGWREATELHDHCWIGLPIDTTLGNPQTIPKYARSENTPRSPNTGQFSSGPRPDQRHIFEDYMPPEFSDPDWWWFFGYWWGDGHRTKTQVGVVIANKDLHIKWRIEALLNRYKKPYSIFPKPGCLQLVFASTHLSRWLQTWRRPGAARKQPPAWVEHLPLEYQRQLARGYIDADGYVREYKEGRKGQEIRITSVYAEGLLCLRRILSRLNIPASVTMGTKPYLETFPSGHQCITQQKYELRIQENAAQLGFNIHKGNRYKFNKSFIADGYLWAKIRSVEPVSFAEFVPIKTTSGTYTTHFGLSHNCLDEFDSKSDSPDVVKKKESIIAGSVFGTQVPDTLILMAQNLIHGQSVALRTYKRRNELLSRRRESGLVKAFTDDLDLEMRGTRWAITKGQPTWTYFDMGACQKFLDTSGPIEFFAEYQHEFDRSKEGKVFKNYRDKDAEGFTHVITEEEFASVYGVRRPPASWNKWMFNDKARTKSESHANVAGTLTMSSQNTPLPGVTFLYDCLAFEADSQPDDCAIEMLKCITPWVRVDGIDYQWEDLLRVIIAREGIERFAGSLYEQIKAQREGLAKIIPKYVAPLLASQHYQKFRMSHEADDWRKVYREVFGLPFVAANPAEGAGIEMINLAMKVDETVRDPFRPWQMGMSRFYIIVKKEKIAYPNDNKPDLLFGSDLARYQLTEHRYLPPKINALGEEERGQEKRNDDVPNGLQFFYMDHSIQARELTPEEMFEAQLAPPLQQAAIDAETDPEKKRQQHYAREVAIRRQLMAKITENLGGGRTRGSAGSRLADYRDLERLGK